MKLLVRVAILFLLAFVSKFENFWHDLRRQQVMPQQLLIVVLVVSFLIRGEEAPSYAMRDESIHFFLFL